MDSPDKKTVDEKRVRPTVIRRRAKEVPPEPSAPPITAKPEAPVKKQAEEFPKIGLRPVGEIKLPQTARPQPRTGAAQPSGPAGVFPPAAAEKEEKFKKDVAPKKK